MRQARRSVTRALIAGVILFNSPLTMADTDTRSFIDYSVSPPLKVKHPTNSWAVRIGPFSSGDQVSRVLKKVSKVSPTLMRGKTLAEELIFVTRASPNGGANANYLEVSKLSAATAQKTCGPFLKKGFECTFYDKALFDASRRAFLKMISLLEEPNKIRPTAQECYQEASASKLSADLVSCFLLDYSYAQYISRDDWLKANNSEFLKSYWIAEAKLQKEMVATHASEGFDALSIPVNERAALMKSWEAPYTEVPAWYNAQTVVSMNACLAEGIGSDDCP